MELLNKFKDEMFSSIQNKNLKNFRKVFLEFDNYVLSLTPDKTDRNYLKQCFETYQELYSNILLHSLKDFYSIVLKSKNNILNLPHKVEQNLIIFTIHTNIDSILQFYSQEIMYAFFEHLQSLEKQLKVNLVIIGLGYLFSKTSEELPGNLLLYTLMKFKMPFAHYHYLIKLVDDLKGDEFFENDEVVDKLLFVFNLIDDKKADEVICTIGQLAVQREHINLFKSIQKALNKGNIQSKNGHFTGDMLKFYLTRFNSNNKNFEAVLFLNKTLITGEKSSK